MGIQNIGIHICTNVAVSMKDVTNLNTKYHNLVCKQSGQAMVETLVVLVVVAGLWIGISWIGKIQDLALNNNNVSSYAAFASSFNQNQKSILDNSKKLLSKQAHQWRNHDGSIVLKDSYQDLELDWQRTGLSADAIQIGMGNNHAKHLREQWLAADTGILSVYSSLNSVNKTTNNDIDDKKPPKPKSNLNLEFFLQNFPKISRHTSIATGAAYSYGDQDTANHIQKSNYGWSDATNNSYDLGKKIDDIASSVDGGWSRTRPKFDWLHPWQDLVPEHLNK